MGEGIRDKKFYKLICRSSAAGLFVQLKIEWRELPGEWEELPIAERGSLTFVLFCCCCTKKVNVSFARAVRALACLAHYSVQVLRKGGRRGWPARSEGCLRASAAARATNEKKLKVEPMFSRKALPCLY